MMNAINIKFDHFGPGVEIEIEPGYWIWLPEGFEANAAVSARFCAGDVSTAATATKAN